MSKDNKDIANEIADAFVARVPPKRPALKTPPVDKATVMRDVMQRTHTLMASGVGVLLGVLSSMEKDKGKLSMEQKELVNSLRVHMDMALGLTVNLWLAMNRHLIHFGADDEDGMIEKFNTLMAKFSKKTTDDIKEHVLPAEPKSEDKKWFEGITEFFERSFAMISMRKTEGGDGR